MHRLTARFLLVLTLVSVIAPAAWAASAPPAVACCPRHPGMVELFCRQASKLLAGLDEEPSWESVLALEPGTRAYLSDERFDTACQAMADFADIKSPYTLGHSSGVASLAAEAARRCGLPESDAAHSEARRVAA